MTKKTFKNHWWRYGEYLYNANGYDVKNGQRIITVEFVSYWHPYSLFNGAKSIMIDTLHGIDGTCERKTQTVDENSCSNLFFDLIDAKRRLQKLNEKDLTR